MIEPDRPIIREPCWDAALAEAGAGGDEAHHSFGLGALV
jgi:hypothetical protein